MAIKKLCAHVKKQREAGIQQLEMARSRLNVEQLFNDDLHGLTSEEDETLRKIAKSAPVPVSELSDDLNRSIILSLIDRRLVVRVGNKYDIYWDIFRDFLNTGKIPVQELYLLRSNYGTCMNCLKILVENNGTMSRDEFKNAANLSEGAFLNMIKDLKFLHLADADENNIFLRISVQEKNELLKTIIPIIADKLRKNQSVYEIISTLNEIDSLSLENTVLIMKQQFPYIAANDKTWKTYALVLVSWLDMTDLAIYDRKNAILLKSDGVQIQGRELSFYSRKKHENPILSVRIKPIVEVAWRIMDAVKNKAEINYEGISPSTISKALANLEDLKLIQRRKKTISVSTQLFDFVKDEKFRKAHIKNTVSSWRFFQQFIILLNEHKENRIFLKDIAKIFIERSGVNWSEETTLINIKIMLDWARFCGDAPMRYAEKWKRGTAPPSDFEDNQLDLFNFIKEVPSKS